VRSQPRRWPSCRGRCDRRSSDNPPLLPLSPIPGPTTAAATARNDPPGGVTKSSSQAADLQGWAHRCTARPYNCHALGLRSCRRSVDKTKQPSLQRRGDGGLAARRLTGSLRPGAGRGVWAPPSADWFARRPGIDREATRPPPAAAGVPATVWEYPLTLRQTLRDPSSTRGHLGGPD
jgi:hypothetical protein